LDFERVLNQKAGECDALLKKYLDGLSDDRTPLYDAMRHSVNAGGKRLRMMAVIESARMFTDDVSGAAPFACAAEFIHTYSLIHDDLPAMDDAEHRRGLPCCHRAFGECAAILAGDALLNYAFEIMSDAPQSPANMPALREIAVSAGVRGMVLGQALDTLLENPPDIETLKDIYDKKTASMFRGPMRAGAMIAGADEEGIGAAGRFAGEFGLAFQIVDDIIDEVGAFDSSGKDAGADKRNRKTTYASLLGVGAARGAAAEHMERAIEIIAPLDRNGFFNGLCGYVMERATP